MIDTVFGPLLVLILFCAAPWIIFCLPYWLRDKAYNVIFVNEDPWIAKIVLFPFWLILAALCLVYSILGTLFFGWLAYDAAVTARDWWHKK